MQVKNRLRLILPVMYLGALGSALFSLPAWSLATRLLVAAVTTAAVLAAAFAFRLLRANGAFARHGVVTLAESRAEADRRAAVAGQSPRDAVCERASAV